MTPPAAPTPGLFIVFEGGEGAGKSTQVALLRDALTTAGIRTVLTREPGATRIGTQIRAMILDPANKDDELADRAEALLYAADRAQHVGTLIRPALTRGDTVLCDRYIDSSLAYQGHGRGHDLTDILRLSLWAANDLLPDLTIVLDLPPATGMNRVDTRGNAKDRFEQLAGDFHDRVRHGFLTQAATDPDRYLILDATATPDAVHAAVLAAVTARHPSGHALAAAV